MSPEMIGGLMILAMLVGIFIGYPISFLLIFLGIAFGYWGFGELVFYQMTLQFYSTMMEQTLTAVPLFVFMGIMMEQANLMERLFDSCQQLLARLKGSLYLAVMFVATIFAAATGIVGASVTILGIMAGKSMIRSKYDVQMSAGLIAAGGTLGILIPPSIMLVVMGPILEVPVTTLFTAAVVPGLLLATLFTGYAMVRCSINPSLGPPLEGDAIIEDRRKVWVEFFKGLVPPAALVLSALGSIMFGFATPTEGAACGALGSLLLTLSYRKLNYTVFRDSLIKTLQITVLILFLVAASNFFGAVFARLGTPSAITEWLLSLEMNPYLLLAMIMVGIFLLAWPLEWVPIVLIVVPFVVPIIDKLGFDLVWFGILVAVCLQTAWLSPPVAMSAYFLKGVVPEWDLGQIYRGMLQFMGLQILGLVIIVAFPEIVLWLPRLLEGG
ncbi:MAG: TRAP transporter large permease [Burkholderiaceae bacterium]